MSRRALLRLLTLAPLVGPAIIQAIARSPAPAMFETPWTQPFDSATARALTVADIERAIAAAKTVSERPIVIGDRSFYLLEFPGGIPWR